MSENKNIEKVVVFSLVNKKDFISQKIGSIESEEEYAIDIKQVKEIINYEKNITRMPGKPNYVVGILNLRGETIPIMDMGYRLNYDIDYDKAKIIVVYIHGEKVGLIVQSVKDVLNINMEKDFEEAPYKKGMEFVVGIIKKHEYTNEEDEELRKLINTRIISVLDSDKIIKEEDTKCELVD